MTRFVALLALTLLPLSATAQSAATPHRQATGSTASIAPPPDEDETGWRVIQLPNGYARYRVDDSDSEAPPGGLTIVPRMQEPPPRNPPGTNAGEEAVPPPENVVVQSGSPSQEPAGPPATPPPPPGAEARSCLWPQALLAQRLMELRGVELDPAAALLVLSQQTIMTSNLSLNLFGRPLPLGDTFLATAISSDTVTLDLATDLAYCLLP